MKYTVDFVKIIVMKASVDVDAESATSAVDNVDKNSLSFTVVKDGAPALKSIRRRNKLE